MVKRVTVICELDVYEGDDLNTEKKIGIRVSSHWNRREVVHLYIGEKRYTVVADDLIEAMSKCKG